MRDTSTQLLRSAETPVAAARRRDQVEATNVWRLTAG